MVNNYQFPYSKIIRENGEVVSANDHNKQENQIECLTDALGNYQFSSGTIESRFVSVGGDITTIMTDITNIEGDIVTIQGDITTINGDIVSIQGDITTIQGDITTIQGDITTIQGDVTTLQGDLSALDVRVTDLENAPDPVSNLDDLGDVYAQNPEEGDLLTYTGNIGTGSVWAPRKPVLSDISDVFISDAQPGDSLVLAPGTGTGDEIWIPEDRRMLVASAVPGDPDESEAFPVTEIRFVSNSAAGGDHEVIEVEPGVVYIGGGAPPSALSTLDGLTGLVTGRLSTDGGATYPPGVVAGDVYASITQNSTWSFTTAAGEFSNASLGNLILAVNGVDVANLDLAANFVEGNRIAGQDMADYDITGTGDAVTNGVISFVGGSLTLNSVAPLNSIPVDQYQQGAATISLTAAALRTGYNIVTLRHVTSGTSTATLEWFYDTDADGNPNDPDISATDLAEDTPVLKYLSGVSYYDTGSTFDLDVTGNDLFDNVYVQTNAPLTYIASSSWAASGSVLITDPTVTGVSTPPAISETMTVTNFGLTVVGERQVNDAQVTITPVDPYGTYTTATTASKDFAIMSVAPNSTDVFDDFTDERYRLPNTTNFNVVVPGMPGPPSVWDSTISLTNAARAGELQVYDPDAGATQNRIHYPNIDYSVNFNPQPNPNYSGLAAGNRTYYRVFRSTSGDKTSGIITFPGIAEADLGAGIGLRIKVPTKTVWLDLTVAFNGGTFPTGAPLAGGVDGEGCRINSGTNSLDINNSIEFSLGAIGTDLTSDRQLILEITYASAAATEILGSGSGLSINW